MAAIKTALYLLISLFFDAYIYVLLLRLFLQKLGASWYNPLTQIIIKLTNPVIKPFRRFIPGFRGFDGAIILLVIALQLVEVYLLFWLQTDMFLKIIGAIIISIALVGTKIVNIFFYATIIGAIISWFPNLQSNPVADVVAILTEPLLRVTRRYVPIIGGFDFSPIVIIVGCLLINILIFAPLYQYGLRAAF